MLSEVIVGKFITKLFPSSIGRYKLKHPVGFEDIIRDLPLKIEDINAKGKFMWWTLVGNKKTWYMWCTYGMSGQWSAQGNNHVSFIVEYNDSGNFVSKNQQKIFFNDQRRFGTIKFISDVDIHNKKLASLGPDVLDDPPVALELFVEKILKKPTRTISEALMDQSCIAGVGNYLRAEILYDCKVDPWKNVTELVSEEYMKLCEATVKIAKASYRAQGASIRTYRNVDGSKGISQFEFKVYGRKECPSGHQVIRKRDDDGRTMHWCPTCQK